MQFANDITQLTLASTAKLRESLNNNTLHSPVRAAFHFELQSRIPDSRLEEAHSEIEHLKGKIDGALRELE